MAVQILKENHMLSKMMLTMRYSARQSKVVACRWPRKIQFIVISTAGSKLILDSFTLLQ